MNKQTVLIFESQQPLNFQGMWRRPIMSEWCTPQRTISDYQLMFAIRGSLNYCIEGQPVRLKEGEVRLFLPHRVHSAPKGQSALVYYFHFIMKNIPPPMTPTMAIRRLAEARKVTPADPRKHFMPQMRFDKIVLCDQMSLGAWRGDILSLLRIAEEENENPTCNGYWRIADIVREILFLLTRRSIEILESETSRSEHGNWSLVQRALSRIRENHTGPLNVQSLAHSLSVPPQTLIRQFRNCLGSTPLQAIHDVRLKRAHELMRDPALSLKEVAYAIGMRDPGKFSRWFLQHQGCTPREYRKRQESAPKRKDS